MAAPQPKPLEALEDRSVLAVERPVAGNFFPVFSVIGFFNDLMTGGRTPYAVVIAMALLSGLNSALWAFASIRLPTYWLLGMIVLRKRSNFPWNSSRWLTFQVVS